MGSGVFSYLSQHPCSSSLLGITMREPTVENASQCAGPARNCAMFRTSATATQLSARITASDLI
ncbi:hypothetical protein ANCCAN_05491 [Ancylostoma caninum]|uniref:Uncharacterized protein n=1 Tax=Ancylostoma caninum TaxID=29170 RepID=A0A368GZP2_ANCCA|nr:hypothetical protein ANCCAN_05491 [Ancylostoma caninum]